MKLRIKATMLRKEDCVLFKRGDIARFLYDDSFSDGEIGGDNEWSENLRNHDRSLVVITGEATGYDEPYTKYYDFIFLNSSLKFEDATLDAISALHLQKVELSDAKLRIVRRQLDLLSRL